jgi:hypothetical protein
VEFESGETIMKNYLRLLSDRQTGVLTVPSLDCNSLHDQSLRQLSKLFRHAAERFIGSTCILDVTPVKAAGAGFLTEVNRLATALAEKQIELAIAGDLGGLWRLVGWQKRFRLYDDLVAAIIASAECSPREKSEQSWKQQSSNTQDRLAASPRN